MSVIRGTYIEGQDTCGFDNVVENIKEAWELRGVTLVVNRCAERAFSDNAERKVYEHPVLWT